MSRAYLIAEAGVNHGGDFRTAGKMMQIATRSGCDAIKFQVYDPEKLATADAPAYWDTSLEPTLKQRDLFQAHSGLKKDDYWRLSVLAGVEGIDLICSVFHVEDVEWLAPLVSHFKIASADITNRPLLKAVAATGKPVILSTGAATLDEIANVTCWIKPRIWALLHCTLSYPTDPENVNLSAIESLLAMDAEHVGYSDHSHQFAERAIVGAYHCGARVFEKHFSLTPNAPGNDHYHSLNGAGFQRLRESLDFAAVLQGSGGKRVLDCEQAARSGARRSLTSTMRIPRGARITPSMVTLKRPGTGLTSLTATATAATDIPADTTLTEAMLA